MKKSLYVFFILGITFFVPSLLSAITFSDDFTSDPMTNGWYQMYYPTEPEVYGTPTWDGNTIITGYGSGYYQNPFYIQIYKEVSIGSVGEFVVEFRAISGSSWPNNVRVDVISASTSPGSMTIHNCIGYQFFVFGESHERFDIYKFNASGQSTLLASKNLGSTIHSWHTYKITRTADGSWTVLMDGSSMGITVPNDTSVQDIGYVCVELFRDQSSVDYVTVSTAPTGTETVHFPLEVSNTGYNATIVIPTSSIPTIYDSPITTGDEIGVFTPRGLCAGVGVWEGENLPITVWGDDPDEPGVLGFQTGESLLFKIWDASEETEYYATATYSQGEGTYTTDALMIISSLLAPGGSWELFISLQEGWNMISSNVIPEDPSMEAVFADIVTDVIIVKNGQGQVYWPEFESNQIEDWIITAGYKVKMKTAADLEITGQCFQPYEITYDLLTGWNLISFIATDGMSPSDAFAQIVSDIIIIKNCLGQVYWPEFGIDQIDSLHIGEGYKIKLSSAVTFNYPGSASKISVASASAADLNHFIPVSHTGYNATIAVSTDTVPSIGDIPLVTGDEIGVFYLYGRCVGAVVWEGKNTAITVWGDDPYTDDTIEGIQAGEEYIFKIWSATTDIEYNAIATYSLGSSSYEHDAIVVLESLVVEIPTSINYSQAPEELILYQNYPNPFNPKTTINFFLPEYCHVILKVYNTVGEEVVTLVDSGYSTGIHSIEWDASDLSSGIYFYKLHAGTFEKTKKFMLMK